MAKKTPQIKYRMLGDTIKVMFSGKSFTYRRGDKRFDQVVDAIRSGNEAKVPGLCDFDLIFKDTGFKFDRDSRRCTIDGKDLPLALNKKIVGFLEEGVNFKFLVDFWRKLQENPSFNSRKMLFDFLKHNGHPLTQNGNFIAYRYVTDDYKDCHTKTMDNSIGKTVEMPREDVDDNPNNTCSSGLHVAAFDYVKNNSKVVLVEVDPADVVAVPTDYNGTKMRVCRFKVLKDYTNDGELDTEFLEV